MSSSTNSCKLFTPTNAQTRLRVEQRRTRLLCSQKSCHEERPSQQQNPTCNLFTPTNAQTRRRVEQRRTRLLCSQRSCHKEWPSTQQQRLPARSTLEKHKGESRVYVSGHARMSGENQSVRVAAVATRDSNTQAPALYFLPYPAIDYPLYLKNSPSFRMDKSPAPSQDSSSSIQDSAAMESSAEDVEMTSPERRTPGPRSPLTGEQAYSYGGSIWIALLQHSSR